MNRRLALMLAAATLAALMTPPAWAHWKPHRHAHRHAVIVIGKPRPAKRTVVVNGRPQGVLDMNVKPRSTEVWVDGKYRGTCDALDGFPDKLHLAAGPHRIKLVTPQGAQVTRDIQVRAGVEVNVGLDLR